MKKWSGKLVVGLGGGAGTGKDDVQKMLEGFGAFTVDSDEIESRVIRKGAPGYQPVVESFGKGILDQSGQIDQSRLYQIVRSDRQARDKLQSIIGPLIKQATVILLQRAKQSVVFIRATDLSRFDLLELCDYVWITTAPEEVRVSNLALKKGWSAEQARTYIQGQPEVDAQLARADVVLYNQRSQDALRKQVTEAWGRLGERVAPEQKPLVDMEAGLGPVLSCIPDDTHDAATPSIRIAETGTEFVASIETNQEALPGLFFNGLRLIGRRIFNVLSTLLVIAYLTSWGLILAERGRDHLPAQPLQAAWEALVRVGNYLIHHPQTYYWHKENVAALQVVSETLKASAGLLVLSLILAFAIGLPLGLTAALAKRKTSSALVMLFSVLGISTPSFLFAMFLWVVNIWVHRTFDITVLPSGGFGWDAHMIMPIIVLAMRPLAQIAQVTYVSMRDILGQDYIRTAYSKGLNWRLVRNVHALPNILIPILTTLGSSLRYSLASLPVVEVFFEWQGVRSKVAGCHPAGECLARHRSTSIARAFLFVCQPGH